MLYGDNVTAAAEQRVDMLINNAGLLRTSRDVTTDGFEMHLGVNYLGLWFKYTHLPIKTYHTYTWP